MLKTRIVTALVLIALVLWVLFYFTVTAFAQATVLLMVLAGYEWCNLIPLKNKWSRILYLMSLLVLLELGWFFILPHKILSLIILAMSAIFWVLTLISMPYFNRHPDNKCHGVITNCVVSYVLILACWLGMNILRAMDQGEQIFLFLMLIIWGADSGAYFMGRFFGKHKLAINISPGKTWEGVGGALICGIILTGLGAWWFGAHVLLLFIAIELTVVISVVGDLYESLLKRRVNIKDSGKLLPGHGGILDRIDSLFAATPIFVLALTAFNFLP